MPTSSAASSRSSSRRPSARRIPPALSRSRRSLSCCTTGIASAAGGWVARSRSAASRAIRWRRSIRTSIARRTPSSPSSATSIPTTRLPRPRATTGISRMRHWGGTSGPRRRRRRDSASANGKVTSRRRSSCSAGARRRRRIPTRRCSICSPPCWRAVGRAGSCGRRAIAAWSRASPPTTTRPPRSACSSCTRRRGLNAPPRPPARSTTNCDACVKAASRPMRSIAHVRSSRPNGSDGWRPPTAKPTSSAPGSSRAAGKTAWIISRRCFGQMRQSSPPWPRSISISMRWRLSPIVRVARLRSESTRRRFASYSSVPGLRRSSPVRRRQWCPPPRRRAPRSSAPWMGCTCFAPRTACPSSCVRARAPRLRTSATSWLAASFRRASPTVASRP